MTQRVEHLHRKHKALSSKPQYHWGKEIEVKEITFTENWQENMAAS
jgi:hypothetical protein